MPVPIIAEFTPLELWACRNLASAIRRHKTQRETDATWDGVGFVDRNYKGIKGAYAVARFLGVDFDRDLYDGQDSGSDLVYRGVTIEVKHLQKWLAFNDARHFKGRVAVLVNPLLQGEGVQLVGWVTREEFLERHFVSDFGYGPRLCLKHEDMRDIRTLPLVRLKQRVS